MLPRSLALALALAPATSAGAPEGPPEPLALRYRAPASCPDEQQLRRAIEARLGEGSASAARARLAVEVEVTRVDETRWRLALALRDGVHTSAREFAASSCGELIEAAAWLVALTIDPAAGQAQPVGEPAIPEAPAIAPPAPPPPADVSERRETAPPEPVAEPTPPGDPHVDGAPGRRVSAPHLLVAPAAGVAYGPVPRAVATLELAFALAWRAARLELAFDYLFATTLDDTAHPGLAARFNLIAGSARGCGVLGGARVRVPLCGGLVVGGLRGRGDGPQVTPLVAYSPWLAITADAALEVWVHERVALALVARGLVSVTAPAFHIDPFADDLLHATPAAFWGFARLLARVI